MNDMECLRGWGEDVGCDTLCRKSPKGECCSLSTRATYGWGSNAGPIEMTFLNVQIGGEKTRDEGFSQMVRISECLIAYQDRVGERQPNGDRLWRALGGRVREDSHVDVGIPKAAFGPLRD